MTLGQLLDTVRHRRVCETATAVTHGPDDSVEDV